MAENNLRVMTFNLLTSTKKKRSHPWRLRKRNIARIIATLKPDVVGTQEANFKQLQDLAELLPEYTFIGEGNLGRQAAHEDGSWYCATFFRRDRVRPIDSGRGSDTYWLSPTPEVPASQFNLGTRPRLVTWNTFELTNSGHRFVFGTTHLEAVNSGHRKRSAELLRKYVSRKVEELGSDVPVFLTGDFNAVSDSPEIKAFGSSESAHEPLFDAWVAAGNDESADSGTFRGLGLRDRVGLKILGPRRIDYVFFRPMAIVRSVQRIDFEGLDHREAATPSDHYPVLAEFALAS